MPKPVSVTRKAILPRSNDLEWDSTPFITGRQDEGIWNECDGGYPAGERLLIRTDGKQFSLGETRFRFRGVTYGTFRPREEDGARVPDRDRLKRDFEAIAQAGFTVVRTYTPPPEDLLEYASDWHLRVLVGVFYPDWRYLVGASRREVRRVLRDARANVRATARRLAGSEQVLALCLGNEIPADVLRWVGTRTIALAIDELVEAVREEDPDRLVTYANYPTAEYLPLDSLDFLTFNVFLEQQTDLRRYLTRLQHLAGHRPLVLGEIGLDAGSNRHGEHQQANYIDWQLETALDRGIAGTCVFSWTDEWWVGDAAVDGWQFGLTRADRTPRPALAVAQRWNHSTVADLSHDWPSISVVVCAYNAAATLDECLRHTCALDYPDLEVIVVDDGSTDETARIVAGHPRARLVSIDHGGLSIARNEGLRAARGDMVAYLDSDAYPAPEWPYFLALGMDGGKVGGVGGPNLPPPDDPPGAQVVARAPGGPVHVLIGDDRAEHVPGCNMAFWRQILEEVGGFDPAYTTAGDDVDLCWKVLDRGWEIAFHPAALVWHHRRPGLRAYLRQQRGYGRAEALVEARHPDRFTSLGTARWRGRIYNSITSSPGRQRIYRGMYGTAAYQSVYRGGGHALDVAHQVGLPIAAACLATAPLALLRPPAGAPFVLGLLGVLMLIIIDTARARPPRDRPRGRLRFCLAVAVLHLLQPLVRTWSRACNGSSARRDLPPYEAIAGPIRHVGRGMLLLPDARPRAVVAAAVVNALRRASLRVTTPTGWEDHDGRLIASALVIGDLVTTGHLPGTVQLRVRVRLRPWRSALAMSATAVAATVDPLVATVVLALLLGDVVRGWWRTGPFVARTLMRVSEPSEVRRRG